jgi:hypothetical protein
LHFITALLTDKPLPLDNVERNFELLRSLLAEMDAIRRYFDQADLDKLVSRMKIIMAANNFTQRKLCSKTKLSQNSISNFLQMKKLHLTLSELQEIATWIDRAENGDEIDDDHPTTVLEKRSRRCDPVTLPAPKTGQVLASGSSSSRTTGAASGSSMAGGNNSSSPRQSKRVRIMPSKFADEDSSEEASVQQQRRRQQLQNASKQLFSAASSSSSVAEASSSSSFSSSSPSFFSSPRGKRPPSSSSARRDAGNSSSSPGTTTRNSSGNSEKHLSVGASASSSTTSSRPPTSASASGSSGGGTKQKKTRQDAVREFKERYYHDLAESLTILDKDRRNRPVSSASASCSGPDSSGGGGTGGEMCGGTGGGTDTGPPAPVASPGPTAKAVIAASLAVEGTQLGKEFLQVELPLVHSGEIM